MLLEEFLFSSPEQLFQTTEKKVSNLFGLLKTVDKQANFRENCQKITSKFVICVHLLIPNIQNLDLSHQVFIS